MTVTPQLRQALATLCAESTERPEALPKPAGLPSGAPPSYPIEQESAAEHVKNAYQLLLLGDDEATRQAVLRRLRLALQALTPAAA